MSDNSLEGLTQALDGISLTSAVSTDETVRAAHLLAEASKTDHSIREGLSHRKPLEQLVALINCHLNDSLETVDAALRCIGNACIDNDFARDNVIRLGFSWAIRCLASDTATALLTAKVLYNICLDYEPAQQQCFNDGVHYSLIDLWSNEHEWTTAGLVENMPLILEVLFSICNQKRTDQTDHEPISMLRLRRLVNAWKLPDYPDYSELLCDHLQAEDYAMLNEVCLTYLRDSEVQRQLLEHGPGAGVSVNDVWNLLSVNEKVIDRCGKETEEVQKLLIPQSTSFIWILSDIAANPRFIQPHSLDFVRSSISFRVFAQRKHDAQPRILTAACQVLGNVLWQQLDLASSTELIPPHTILHKPLLEWIDTIEDMELLHAAAGLLLQLSRSSAQVRETISNEVEARSALERLCRHENPQLKQDGIKLLRSLGQDSTQIQQRFAMLAREVVEDAANAGASADTAMIEAPS